MHELNEKKLLNRISDGLFSWIDFKEKGNILCVDEDYNSLSFLDCKNQVKYISNSIIEEQTDKYDYILWREFDKNAVDIEKLINIINSLLKENGVAYLGFTNKTSIRRECGDKNFVGKYSKDNIFAIFNRTNFFSIKIYSVFPDVFYPQFIISNDFYPNENMQVRYFPLYDNPNDINVNESSVLDYLISNKKLHDYANCYLIECNKGNKNVSEYQYITLSMDRTDEYACNTIISNDYVIKKYPFSPADSKKHVLVDNEKYLEKHNVPIAKSVPDALYKVPFYNSKVLTTRLYELLINDINSFYDLFDKYRDIVYSSSDITKMDKDIPILERCYIDLIPLNCLWVDDDFMFIDQEFYINNLSANVIIWRAIKILYLSYPDISDYVLEKDLLARYGINDSLAREYNLFSNDYLDKLRNKDILNNFYKKHTISLKKIEENIYKTSDTKMMDLINKIEKSSHKKYNIGYVAGVFDLFHIGHLNILKRAKEMCNHLIVGVVSDRGVTEYKKVELFIPFEERIEIVRSCKYVDEAHEIPFEHPTTIDAFNMYHFDVQFSGNDYINDPGWLYMKDFLEKNGSEMVFLPYTKDTSSTKIKELINRKGIKK